MSLFLKAVFLLDIYSHVPLSVHPSPHCVQYSLSPVRSITFILRDQCKTDLHNNLDIGDHLDCWVTGSGVNSPALLTYQIHCQSVTHCLLFIQTKQGLCIFQQTTLPHFSDYKYHSLSNFSTISVKFINQINPASSPEGDLKCGPMTNDS